MWQLYTWIATQVIIEMAPISSSAHLKLVETWFKRAFSWDVQDYFKKQNIALSDAYYFFHIPTLCVIVLFFARYGRGLTIQPHTLLRMILIVLIADAITFCCYYIFKKFSISWPLICGMCVTAITLLSTYLCDSTITQVAPMAIIWLGLAQGIALLPGISRLAFTCAVGCYLGFSLFDSFCISWILMVPLMIGAVGKTLITLYQKGTLSQLLNWRICLAMLVSGVISWYMLMAIVLLIFTQKWWLLGWYMILPIGLGIYFSYTR